MVNEEDVTAIVYLLLENVSFRLRKSGWLARTVSLQVRDTKLFSTGCQKTLEHPTNLTEDIVKTALSLFRNRYSFLLPLRSLGIHCDNLMPDDAPEQLDMFDDCRYRHPATSL